MFIKLINKVTEPISVVSEGIREGFARCNSEEEVILLKKVLQDIINDESELRKDQV